MEINLIMLKNNGDRKHFQLPAAITILGRRIDCDLRIPLKEVSRRHCEIELAESQLMIRDLDSSNGTYVNSQKIEQETILNAGDAIQIGPISFIVQIDGKGGSAAVNGSTPQSSTVSHTADEFFAGIDSELDEDNLKASSGTMPM